jgi:flagellar protein FliS
MQYSNRSSAYKETSINTSSPVKLVVMLYEGAIRFLQQAKEATAIKDMEAKAKAVDRAMAIIQHLQGSLDFEKGGQVSFDLDRLYTYISTCIFEGSAKLNVDAFDEAIKLLTTIHSGWEELARKEQDSSPPSGPVSKETADGSFRLHV